MRVFRRTDVGGNIKPNSTENPNIKFNKMNTIKKLFLFTALFFALLSSNNIFATAQAPDKIIIKGEKKNLFSNPMEAYFVLNESKRPKTSIRSTALWRGYIATFEVIENELFVIDIEIEIKDETKESFDTILKSVFKEIFEDNQKVKVDWLNGILVIPYGERISYVHMGYGSTYEFYTLLEIQNGNLTKEMNFGYKEYEIFKEKQFQVFKTSEKYLELKKMMKKQGEKNQNSIDSFIKYFVIEYTSKILDDSKIEIIEPKREVDVRLVGEWFGEEKNKQIKGMSKKWNMKRNPDGTYEINFEFTQDGETIKNTENGKWWTEGNKFFEFHESTGMTDEYEFKVLNIDQVKFKMINTDVDFENKKYTFIDTRVKK